MFTTHMGIYNQYIPCSGRIATDGGSNGEKSESADIFAYVKSEGFLNRETQNLYLRSKERERERERDF